MSFKRSKSYNLRRVDLLVKNNNKKTKILHCSCHYDLTSCTLVFTNEQNIIQSKIAKNGQN